MAIEMIIDIKLQQRRKSLITFAEMLTISLQEKYPERCHMIRMIIHELRYANRIAGSREFLNNTKWKLKVVVGDRHWKEFLALLLRNGNHMKKSMINFRKLKRQKHLIECSKKGNSRKHVGKGAKMENIKELRVSGTLHNAQMLNSVKEGSELITKSPHSQVSCMQELVETIRSDVPFYSSFNSICH